VNVDLDCLEVGVFVLFDWFVDVYVVYFDCMFEFSIGGLWGVLFCLIVIGLEFVYGSVG